MSILLIILYLFLKKSFRFNNQINEFSKAFIMDSLYKRGSKVQIRKNIIAGMREFSLMLPDLKTGAIEANYYKVVENGEFEVEGTNFPCIIVERIRLQDDRTTRYFLAPDLDYLIIKVEDEDQDGDTSLELMKLY